MTFSFSESQKCCINTNPLGLCDNENLPITIMQSSITIITIKPYIYLLIVESSSIKSHRDVISLA